MGFVVGGRWLRLWVGGCQFVVWRVSWTRCDARGADALVDRECQLQVRGALADVAVVQMGLAESFEGACFPPGVRGGRGRSRAPGHGTRGPGRWLRSARKVRRGRSAPRPGLPGC